MTENGTGGLFSSGRYETLLHIASGGMGAVYLGRVRGELGFSRTVAIKILHEHVAGDADVLARFRDEAMVASRVKHPHVVSVVDVVLHGDKPILVLDYVHGESLRALLAASRMQCRAVPVDVTASIVHDVLEGLHAAHEAVDEKGRSLELVHRDLSPQNILVDVNGAAYVTDFGVAKIRARLQVTKSGLVGTPGYLAPEQIRGEPVSRASDVHGVGVVLWEALTGEKLYEALPQQVHAVVQKVAVAPPSMYRKEVGPELDALVLAMLEDEPSRRPSTALNAAVLLRRATPFAPASAIGEWVMDLAGSKLDRRMVATREAPDTPTPTVSAVPGDTAEAADTAETLKAPRRGRLVRVALPVLALATLGVALTRRTVTPDPVAGAPTAVVAAPAEPAPEPPVSATEPPPPAMHAAPTRAAGMPAVRPRKVSCDPPYDVVGGVKRYRRDCFPAR